jgi:hypothetical protein
VLRSRFAAVAAIAAVTTGVLGAPSAYATANSAPRGTAKPGTHQIVIDYPAGSRGYGSSLTLRFHQPVSASTASQIKSSLEDAAGTVRPDAGPTGGEFLVCDKLHSFSDSDGTYTIQHACQGTTGPWGYQISTGLCAIVVSAVSESGMTWTRNGKTMPKQSPHPDEFCRYQFHGTYNPEDDFDLIAYNDYFTFEIEVGGETGNADLHIYGSFYSAECSNPSICK